MRIVTLRYLASRIRRTSESVCPLLAMKMAGFQSFIWYFISRMAGKEGCEVGEAFHGLAAGYPIGAADKRGGLREGRGEGGFSGHGGEGWL